MIACCNAFISVLKLPLSISISLICLSTYLYLSIPQIFSSFTIDKSSFMSVEPRLGRILPLILDL
jgi:hypothetical protein